jgi:2-oxoglutarate ferredoxin oxidoreductase subunit delta
MPKVRVLTEYCKGCGLCVSVCPVEGLEFSDELTSLAVYPPRQKADVRCTGCLGCTLICPDAAIEVIDVEETSELQVNRATARRAR